MHIPNTLLLLSLPLLSTALPTLATGSDTGTTAPQITTVAPKSQSCANAPAPKSGAPECADAQEAAVNIAKSFETYNVTSRAEQAAARNMQSPTYNKKYATSIPSLKGKSSQSVHAGEVLDLLLTNKQYDFGSGAWFLATQCSGAVRTALQKGDEQGWEGYITGCVGTEASQGRKAYWERVVGALV